MLPLEDKEHIMNIELCSFSRRRLLQGVAAFTLLPAKYTFPARNENMPEKTVPLPLQDKPLTEKQKQRLLQALKPLDAQYDPAEQMLRRPYSSPGYHTTLKGGMVHPTRESLAYAVALLDTGEEARRQRAKAILERIVALQDKDPHSKTFGIWSWFLEEPLAKMAPPDFNWADFCGVQLLQVVLDHRQHLPEKVMQEVDTAIQNAARAIQKRNVGPSYTNIALMGTYVTRVAAAYYHLNDLRDYAQKRLQTFAEYTRHHGAFTEYNSPTYTITALQELGRLRLHAPDPLIEELYHTAWEEIAQHFHVPTRQWAGPHSRCYSTLLGKSVPALIERASEGRVAFGVSETTPSLDEHRLPLPCPRELEKYFLTLDAPHTVVKTFLKSEPPLIGTTYLSQAFTLGTINHGDLWNQRRALIAYWGSAREPAYLHLRFLHDGYDFAAAQFFSVQERGSVLAGISFATDGGDTHVSLDKIRDATIRARDLRLRFELGGTAARSQPTAPADLTTPAELDFGTIHLTVAVPYARFGELTGRWAAGREKEKAFLDVVLYSGEERAFRLTDLQEAAIAIALNLGTNAAPAPAVETETKERTLTLKSEGRTLRIPLQPNTIRSLHR